MLSPARSARLSCVELGVDYFDRLALVALNVTTFGVSSKLGIR
jgi:hypothetical protein